MIALIDGDTVAWRCAASCLPSRKKAAALGAVFEELEMEPLEFAIGRADELLYRICSITDADGYRLFLSGGDNWRVRLYPEYKAHRKDVVKPPHLFAVQDFLRERWQAIDCPGYEADDAIGISADDTTIICANDKDMLTIPGSHYNFVKDEFKQVSEEEANYMFWWLMLVGDAADNIKGVAGIGPVKAQRLLTNLDPSEWEESIRDLYNDDERFTITKRLLRIIRSKEELKAVEDSIRQSERQESPENSGQSPA